MNGNRRRDCGSILPLVLVVSVVMSMVVVAIASYATSTLKLGQAVEESGDRIAAAEGGIDYALDRYAKGLTTCGHVGSELTTFEGDVNALEAEVTCTRIGDQLPAASGFALVMTGAGLTESDWLLSREGAESDTKEVRGPIYMEWPVFNGSPSQAPVSLVNGHLLHHDDDAACDDGYVESNLTLPDWFTIAAPGRSFCTTDTWADLFQPNRPIVGLIPSDVDPPPLVDPSGCRIWFPGTYTTAPDFSGSTGQVTYNYFVSGNYYFLDTGEIDLKGSYVLAGYPGIRGPNIVELKPGDTFDNHVCRHAWWFDGYAELDPDGDVIAGSSILGDRQGATWYLGGTSSIFISSNSALEIDGRLQDFEGTALRTRVGLQTVDTEVTGAGEILSTKGGSGSQMAMRGLVWTPESRFNFDNLANDVVVALQAGAVVSSLVAGAAAGTDGFLVEVSSQPVETQLRIESRATNSGTATSRAIVDYQPSPAEVSVISRRILDITPE
jgi:hypothetical protein